MKKQLKELKSYLLLWATQSFSSLGSAMTSFALVLWLYQTSGSALQTALMSVCSYAPYVIMSIFAGTLSDRWDKKRTMLVCDLLAAATTVAILVLYKTEQLSPWHMYVLNALNGLMNTVQRPASDVAATLLAPPEYYQKTSGLRSFSSSLNTILTPVIASAIYAFGGLDIIIAVDLLTFATAFVALLLFIRIPQPPEKDEKKEKLLDAASAGLRWLKQNPLILNLIFFLAWINLVASAFDAALPAYLLSVPNGGETVLGLVQSCAGIATLVGSVIVTLSPKPRDRVRMVCITLMISMSTENFVLALTRSPALWCIGSILGWLSIPIMNANLDVIMRTSIPAEMQGRVFSCRNSLQFFTIPLGFLLGGWMIDEVFEPVMALSQPSGLAAQLFGTGKGSGAAAFLLVLGFVGVTVCIAYWIKL
ncbi:MAG: MFS transporter, partial [Clostridia bacterium]|nr:MFS transporter [Clostridia bacterium]